MTFRQLILLCLVATLAGCSTNPKKFVRYKDLGNPTEYAFHASPENVQKAINKLKGTHIATDVLVWNTPDGTENKITVHDQYSKNYWSGKEETLDQFGYPPAGGMIGTITADFAVKITPRGTDTLVAVVPERFIQQVGRRKKVFTDFGNDPILRNVRSDTYFEYLFLHRVGEILGEPTMPPIKSE